MGGEYSLFPKAAATSAGGMSSVSGVDYQQSENSLPNNGIE